MPVPESRHTMELIDTPHRRFHVADLIVLIAATAIGLTLVLLFRDAVSRLPPVDRVYGGWDQEGLVLCFYPLLEAWTLALSVRYLIGSRRTPPGVRPYRSVGEQTCILASLGLIILWVGSSAFLVGPQGRASAANIGGFGGSPFTVVEIWRVFVVTAPSMVGLLVLGGWLSLLIGGHWRCDRCWFERSGIILGMLWIVMSLVSLIVLPICQLARWGRW
jgi:hypothetical protein